MQEQVGSRLGVREARSHNYVAMGHCKIVVLVIQRTEYPDKAASMSCNKLPHCKAARAGT